MGNIVAESPPNIVEITPKQSLDHHGVRPHCL
jgi:hypothetical protein